MDAGEQAATDPAAARAHAPGRVAIEQQRLDYEAAEKRRQADEEARELEQLKEQARAHVHELEAKYNGGAKPAARPSAVPWWDGPHPAGKIERHAQAGGLPRQAGCA